MATLKARDGQSTTIFGHRQAQQCAARSKRSGIRCKRAASVGKAVCAIHGGKSTGPKTEAGWQAQTVSVTVHGRETHGKRRIRKQKLAELRKLEAQLLGSGLICDKGIVNEGQR